MQNAAFTGKGLDYVYLPFRVPAGQLEKAVQGLRALDFAGVNVTIPHKVAVMPLLDEIDGLAEYIGAVNTIVNRNGVLKGYNTDAAGFYEALVAGHITIPQKKIVVLGAGGAARAIAFILADKRAKLTILNRTPGSAEAIARLIFKALRVEVKTGELTDKNLKSSLVEADILVNTTSLGMSPRTSDTPVPAALLSKDQVVVDIIYNPWQTRLLKEAGQKGSSVISGLEMLVRQGTAAFELWTGVKAPVDIMRKAVEEALKKNEE